MLAAGPAGVRPADPDDAAVRWPAKVVVIGQVAGIMHGSAELTGDLDLLWDGRSRQADELERLAVVAGQ